MLQLAWLQKGQNEPSKTIFYQKLYLEDLIETALINILLTALCNRTYSSYLSAMQQPNGRLNGLCWFFPWDEQLDFPCNDYLSGLWWHFPWDEQLDFPSNHYIKEISLRWALLELNDTIHLAPIHLNALINCFTLVLSSRLLFPCYTEQIIKMEISSNFFCVGTWENAYTDKDFAASSKIYWKRSKTTRK